MRGDFKEVAYGYCKCGCGNKTTIAKQNHAKKGWIKGKPLMFLAGHNNKRNFGKDAPNWKSGKIITKRKNTNYFLIHMPEHPRSDKHGYVREHILIVEKTLNWPLPGGAVVHHIDGNGMNNKLFNLMVFKNNAEHLKFHTKQRRFENG